MTKYEGGQVTISWDKAGGTAWTVLGQVGDLNGPSISRTAIDATTRDSASNFWREFVPGYKDGGELGLNVMLDPALHGGANGLLSDFNNNSATIPSWRILFPDGAEMTFDGFVSGADISSSIDEVLTADFSVKVSGPITLP